MNNVLPLERPFVLVYMHVPPSHMLRLGLATVEERRITVYAINRKQAKQKLDDMLKTGELK